MNYLELYDQAMRDLDHDRISFDEFEKRIKPLKEEVRPTGNWIPVSEKLPEIHRNILLELRSGEILMGFRAETKPYFYVMGVGGCYVEPENVIAWMPLPEPYKAESEV